MHPSPLSVHGPLTLRVEVGRQLLEVRQGDQVVTSYPVSTSKYGLGTEEGSKKTPLGNFLISEKIGRDAPERMIFRSRLPMGMIAELGGEEDLILTRIFRLQGLDPENANSWDRYIYIHGTNQEGQIGQPASHGCVRMRNADIVELFDYIPEGTPLEIVA